MPLLQSDSATPFSDPACRLLLHGNREPVKIISFCFTRSVV